MQNMMGEPANPLMQMFQETISGVIAAAGKASEIAQQQNPARNIPGVPQNKPIAPPQAEPVTEVVQQAPHSAVAVANPPSNGRPLTAPQLATQLLQHPNWPDDMKHPEWKTILVEMHGTAPAESVGVRVANILETMHNKGILREDLARVFTDDSNQPASEFLRPIFDTFPVAESDPDRYLGILRGIDGEIGDFEVTEEAATQEDTP